MRVLYWHVYSLDVKHVQKALRSADDVSKRDQKFEDGVVVLMSLEKDDDKKENLFDIFYRDLKEYLSRIGAKKVFLYPYAHLSSNLLKPSLSKELFYRLVSYLKDRNMDVDYAEFGWYKEFKVHVRGHPLAELSRVF